MNSISIIIQRQENFIIIIHGLRRIGKKMNQKHEVFSSFLLQVTSEFHFWSYLLSKTQITLMSRKYSREENETRVLKYLPECLSISCYSTVDTMFF